MRVVAGCDLGKATARFVVGRVSDSGVVALHRAELVAHDGDPLGALRDWYGREAIGAAAALGATGLHADELQAPVISGLPEDACLELALQWMDRLTGPLNLVTVGARGYSVLTRAADGRMTYLENDKCSSGTGETMVKIAGRFGFSISEADELASRAEAGIPITARCSVFAKSEMTHFGNQGRPADQLFRGYFQSISNYVLALLARARVDGPIYVIGGGARIGSLVQALQTAVGPEVSVAVPEHSQYFEAIGAMVLAAEQLAGGRRPGLPDSIDEVIHSRVRRFRRLPAAQQSAGRVVRMESPAVAADAHCTPAVLGLDLGSTGSKAVLTAIDSGELVLDLYDRTRGNPVEATRRLMEAVLATGADVRAIGLTGSGREAAATVVRAAFPEAAERIVVINEIVAHATAAIRCDDHDGRSLSIVEIGGQDAKFIQIVGGQIVESDMNKACSAGTGSFLEEQAVFYGIDDIEQFTAIAQQAVNPPDLGQMCTVFVADAAAEARSEGFELAELFGGFQYSVIHNYINRVMGQRTFGDRIFFQGKPATGPSLAWTLAAVADREVVVPPNPGAMGAWGIGLCALEELGRELLGSAPSLELSRSLGAEVVERREFQCRDKQCMTLCTIEKTTVEVGGEQHAVLSGGACPKFEISTATRPKLSKDAPSAVDERLALLDPYLAGSRNGQATVAVPMVGTTFGYMPWLVTLLQELGCGVQVVQSESDSLARGEERCYSFDACAPVKIAHGVLDVDVGTVFFPKLLSLSEPCGGAGKTCPMEQALPEMVRAALHSRGRSTRFVHPPLSLRDGLTSRSLERQLTEAAGELGLSQAQVRARLGRAMHRAAAAQERYQRELAAIGTRTLEYARRHQLNTVLVAGQLHVIHDSGVNAGIPRLLRDNGVLVLPMDCYPIPSDVDDMPRIAWAETNRALRAAVAARGRGDVYPLMLTSFGCGPASFAEQIFSALMEGYPHTVLESDGHGGTAGYVTRVQAFLHAVRHHDRAPSAPSARRLGYLHPLPEDAVGEHRDAHIVVLPVADRVAPISAAVFRSYGIDAEPGRPSSAESLAAGRRDCSGKECLPYQLLWGAFRSNLEQRPPESNTVLLQVPGEGMCRNCMFSVKDQLSVERMGLADKVSLRHFGPQARLGPMFFTKVWAGLVCWDLFNQLVAYHRPLERHTGEADALYERYCDEVETIVGRPARTGVRGLAVNGRNARDLLAVVERAAEEFAALRERAAANPDRRTVLLSGDIYVRLDEFAGDRIVRRLNERHLQVLVEPLSALSEYTAEERVNELFGLPTGLVDNAIAKAMMVTIRRQVYRRAIAHHPWLPMTDARTIIDESRPVLDRFPVGEAPVTIGSVLHHWRTGVCDGVVVASPWGCGPALVAESLLRHQREIPLLFVYSDGSPLDDRRLNAYAFRLQRSDPVRTVTP